MLSHSEDWLSSHLATMQIWNVWIRCFYYTAVRTRQQNCMTWSISSAWTIAKKSKHHCTNLTASTSRKLNNRYPCTISKRHDHWSTNHNEGGTIRDNLPTYNRLEGKTSTESNWTSTSLQKQSKRKNFNKTNVSTDCIHSSTSTVVWNDFILLVVQY